MRAATVLAQREVVRYFRQPSRLLGSLAQPPLFWLFLGAGFSGSFEVAGGLMVQPDIVECSRHLTSHEFNRGMAG